MAELLDLIIVGGGPAGLGCAVEAKKRDLRFWVLEKGCLVNSIYRFPVEMKFFTTPELIEIGDIPLIVSSEKPYRPDALKYYRRVAKHYQLPVKDYERVLAVGGADNNFGVQTRDRFGVEHSYRCRKLIVSTGYYDNPNMLNIPGEDLPKVSHYYHDSHPYYGKEMAVIGGGNSAAEAALDLYRNGAKVTLIHRGEAMAKAVKYWVLPDINNRIRLGEFPAFFRSHLEVIREKEIVVRTPEGVKTLENDFVLALTGYHPDQDFLLKMGIEMDPETFIPAHNPDTLESNVAGIYLAGAIVSGRMTNRIFIENGRFHGLRIFRSLNFDHRETRKRKSERV